MTQEEKIEKLTDALRLYANPNNWVRGIIWHKTGKYDPFGWELADKILKEVNE